MTVDYTIKEKPSKNEAKEEKLRRDVIKYMADHQLKTADMAKNLEVSARTLDNYLKGYFVSERTLSLIENFLNIKVEDKAVVLTPDEYRFVSSLDLSSDFNRARAVGHLLAMTNDHARGPITDSLIGGGKDRNAVVAKLYKAITTSNWVVKNESVYVIKLPSGHYATEAKNAFGDITIEWVAKRTINSLVYASQEEAERALPEFRDFIVKEKVNGGLPQNTKIL